MLSLSSEITLFLDQVVCIDDLLCSDELAMMYLRMGEVQKRYQQVVFELYSKLFQQNNNNKFEMQDQKTSGEKTTTADEEKRCKLIEKLETHNPQFFREADINDFDLNVSQNFKDLEHVDELITPLVYCAYFGLKEICRFLLKNKKIDVDLQTPSNRQTPLTVACMRGNYEIVRLLVLANAEINKPNGLNQSPLTVIVYRLADEPITFENSCICFRIAEFLIDHGADVNWIVDKNRGFSLLHYFCSVKMKMNNSQKDLNYRIIKFLIEKGADINQRTLKDQLIQDLLQAHCNKESLLALVSQMKQKASISRIPKHKIKRLGEDYFKIDKSEENPSSDKNRQ